MAEYSGVTKVKRDRRTDWVNPALPRVPREALPELLAVVEKWTAPAPPVTAAKPEPPEEAPKPRKKRKDTTTDE